LLDGLEDRPAALGPVVELHLARGEADLVAEKIEQRLEHAEHEKDVLVAPLHLMHARVEIARSNATAARTAVASAAALASKVARGDLVAAADVLCARVARLSAETPDIRALESAIEGFSELGMPLEEGDARLELARAFAPDRRHLAIEQARAALRIFERLGAARHADEAAAMLRDLGAPGRTMPRTRTTLTKREREVLGLLRDGLSNAEIAERLVISPRTAEHHVRSILAKLDLRNRAEAAAYAAAKGFRPSG
jgi:DNA-binding NarL/FixJ family response regulator